MNTVVKKVRVRIEGTRPLLMNKFGAHDEVKAVTKGKKDYGTPLEQACKAAYFDAARNLLMPTTWIIGALRGAATYFKQQGKRSTYKNLIASSIIPDSEFVIFENSPTLDNIEIDSRGAVVQRARIVRHRPKLSNWAVELLLSVDTELVALDTLKNILMDSGKTQGIGDFRISKGGPFGQFTVTDFEEVT